jgi:hypothetical protein
MNSMQMAYKLPSLNFEKFWVTLPVERECVNRLCVPGTVYLQNLAGADNVISGTPLRSNVTTSLYTMRITP